MRNWVTRPSTSFAEFTTAAHLSPKPVPFCRDSLPRGNNLCLDDKLRGLRHLHGFAERVCAPQDIGVEVAEVFKSFPCEKFVIAGSDSSDGKPSGLIGRGHPVKFRSAPEVGNQHGLYS